MSRAVRCRRYGRLFLPEPFDVVGQWRRLCPRCRGPLPPTGGVLAGDRLFLLIPHRPPEVAP